MCKQDSLVYLHTNGSTVHLLPGLHELKLNANPALCKSLQVAHGNLCWWISRLLTWCNTYGCLWSVTFLAWGQWSAASWYVDVLTVHSTQFLTYIKSGLYKYLWNQHYSGTLFIYLPHTLFKISFMNSHMKSVTLSILPKPPVFHFKAPLA